MRRHSMFLQHSIAVLMLVAAAMLFTANDSHAQTTGNIYGTITDASGAAIPGADVLAENNRTNLNRAAITDDQGGYRLTLLPVGVYSVSVTLQGFSPARQNDVEVHATEDAHVNLTLQVGQVTSQVIVSGSITPQVDTSTSTLGKVVEERRIVDLPLNGRNFLQLGTIQAGVVAAPVGIQATGSGTDNTPGGTSNQFSVNGMKITSNNHLLDGANNVEGMTGAAMVVPSPDTIEEFRILTNNYSAEYGRAGGSIVTVVTKSGTNAFHGSAYEFLRNDVLDARNFFSPEVPTLKQNQFGFTVGGPIVADKTFFFGGYEGFRQRKGRATNALVPSLKLRNGDFSDLPVANRPNQPFSGDRWENDIIPLAFHDPVARQVLNLWPLPNQGPDNWVSTPVGSNDRDQFVIKIDHSFLDGNNTLTGRYFLDEGDLLQPNGLFGQNQGFIDVPGFAFSDSNRFQNLTVADTHIFGNSVINEFRFAYARARIGSGKEISTINNRDFGFTYPTAGEGGDFFPPHAVAPFSGLGYPVRGNDRVSRTFQFANNVSINKGRHSLKFGVDIRRYNVFSDFPSTNHGNFNFNFGFVTGSPYGDFLLGQPSFFLQTAGASVKELFKTDMYLYFHDTFRINPRLTLNFGLRYELAPGFMEKNDLQFAVMPGVQSTVSPTLPTGLVRPGDPGVSRRIIGTDKNNFGPRVGLSWDLTGDGKTSLRAGGGIFYDDTALISSTTLQMPPEIQAFYFVLVAFDPTTTYGAPFGGNSPVAGDLTPPLPIIAGLPVTTLDLGLKLGSVGHWNLTLQRQLTPAMAVEVAYVGNSGWNLNSMNNDNQAVFGPNVTRDTVGARRPLGAALSDTFTITHGFNQSYHGMQTTLTQRFSEGLSFQAAYTWSSAIDNASTFGTFFNIPGQALDPGHAADLSNDKGLSAFHLRHRFVLSYIYELPFLKDQSGALGNIFGGWRINGITSLQTGSPFTILDASDASFDNTSGDRPNLVGDPNNGPKTPAEWFSRSAFQSVPEEDRPVMQGTAGRNIVLTDGIVNFDFGLTKVFRLTESTKIEFRWEAFNLFNHANFGVPKNNLQDGPALGQILNTSTPERIMQFALKLIF